jgi:hypothetical protein
MAARSTGFRTSSELEASVAGVAMEKNHGKDGKYGKKKAHG